MNSVILVIVLLVMVGAGSCIATGMIRRYAWAKSLLDVPNERSSHSAPTPRGGGLAFGVSFIIGLLSFTFLAEIPANLVIGIAGAGILTMGIGLADDHRDIPPHWRLGVHFAAAAWALFWLGDLPDIEILGAEHAGGGLSYFMAAVLLVWLLNLYNFMDGIDGIAAVEAITVCIGAAVVVTVSDVAGESSLHLTVLPLLLIASVAGFLVWNFPPAKIFMGDAGSGFLGIVLGAMSIQSGIVRAEFFWAWLILLGVFLADATITLVRRILRRERFYQAHRTHAYQHAAIKLGSHRPVSLGVAAVNLLWLTPISILVATRIAPATIGLIVAYIPLVWLALKLGAGKSEDGA